MKDRDQGRETKLSGADPLGYTEMTGNFAPKPERRTKTMKTPLKIRSLTLTTAAILLLMVSTAKADVITDWNEIAMQATITGGRPVPTGMLDMAAVHAAMYDAVQSIERRYQPYYVDIPNASGSPVAAAAQAAHDVLVARFPAQAVNLNATLANYLMINGIPDTDPGLDVGVRAAEVILQIRSCDARFPNPAPPPFLGGTEIGMWRPTPPGNAPMLAPWLAEVTPFLVNRPTQFRSDPPPAIDSRRYARDYDEVKALGSLTGSTRTAEQTDMAHFYAGNPLVYWNRGLRDISNANVTSVAESSKLFALASMAITDSLITAWNDKVHYVLWRPRTAIHNGDIDGNRWTVGDPNWTPLYNEPPYPDYSSGANAVSGAVTASLAKFFETDHMNFELTTTNTGPTAQDTRSFTRFSQAAQEMVDGRVLMGIHFRFADTAARDIGVEIAAYGYRNYFRPITGRRGRPFSEEK